MSVRKMSRNITSRSKRSPTKGWKKSAPRKSSQRSRVKSRCGSRCFLLPRKLKFPICSRNSCKINRKGVQSAYNRSRQYGYTSVARKAKRLLNKMRH